MSTPEITIPADKIGDLREFSPVEGTWSVGSSDDQDAVIPAIVAEASRLTGLPAGAFSVKLFQTNGRAVGEGNSDGSLLVRRIR